MKVRVEQVCYRYENRDVLKEIDFALPKGKITGLVGPNGSGKTTLLKLLSKTLPLQKGKISIEDAYVHQLSSRELSHLVSVVSQDKDVSFDFTVADLVMMGRYPYKKLFETESQSDMVIVDQALDDMDLLEHKDRYFQSLSGGEQQRALIARTLAQQTDLIILDEPTNHLDIYHQIQLFQLFQQLGVTVCAGVHDLNFALTYCDYLLVMKDGELLAKGKPADILTVELIEQVYQVKTDIVYHEASQKKVIVYI